MPTITIDDRAIEVPDDATILDAAERLGIEIPTLCFLKGLEPSTSCLVCVVKNRQTGQFVPACATRVVDGMQIDNATDEVGGTAVEAVHPLRDFHVTLLRLLGLDDAKLTYFHAGREKQLSQTGGEVIGELIA